MKYINAFRTAGPLVLEEGVTAEHVAADCRDAALDFMAGVASGWTKRDLAMWLEGPYAHATRYSSRGERTFVTSVDVSRAALDPVAIDQLLASTRTEMLVTLAESLELDELAHDAVRQGILRRASDENLEPVWLPIDASRMHLKDRVCALFAAHRLDDPTAHATLFLCSHCESVSFDQHAKQSGWCNLHRHQSGIELKRGDKGRVVAVGDD